MPPKIKERPKRIKLTNCKEYTVCDDSLYKYFKRFNWNKNNNGYVQASVEGKCLTMHRMVLYPKKGMHIDHINRNKLDNRRSNLRLLSPKENVTRDRDHKGQNNPFFGKKHNNTSKKLISIARCKEVDQYDKQGIFIARFKSLSQAEAKTGISNGNISSACSGRCRTSGGFIWRYVKSQ